MNLNFRSTSNLLAQNVKKFQQGGSMNGAPEEGGASMPEGGTEGAPMPQEGNTPQGGEDQLAGVAQQLVEMLMQQVGNPQEVATILQMALEMVQGAPEPQQEPVYRAGGILAYRIKK